MSYPQGRTDSQPPFSLVTTTHYLPLSAEIALQGFSLIATADHSNRMVFYDFPLKKEQVVKKRLIAKVSGDETRIYDLLTGQCVGFIGGGFYKWCEEYGDFMEKSLRHHCRNDDGVLQHASIAVVGEPGKMVASTADKWHKPSSVSSTMTHWLASFEARVPEFTFAILNSRDDAGFIQPLCDWMTPLIFSKLNVLRGMWTECPEFPEAANDTDSIIVVQGDEYSEAFIRCSKKQPKEWEEARPDVKASEFLFDGKDFKVERMGKFQGLIESGVEYLMNKYPEYRQHKSKRLNVYLIMTGNARNGPDMDERLI